MSKNIEIKYALVTGASSGIGKCICKSLYTKGYNLVIISSDNDKLEKAYGEISSLRADGKIYTFCVDLSEEGSAQKVYQFIQSQNLKINVLVNNAGVGAYGLHIDQSPAKIDKMLKLNIITLTNLCALFGGAMKEDGGGYILNISSIAAYQSVPYLAAYAASKSYVLNFSEGLAKELEDYNIVVTSFAPGQTNTNFFNYSNVPKNHKFYKSTSFANPEDVANEALKALFDRKLSVVYGFKNKALAFSNRLVPRWLSATISKKLVSK